MARVTCFDGVWYGIAAAMIVSCGGHTTGDSANNAGAGGTGGPGGGDAAPDPILDGATDAGSIGARAVAEFESALRAYCKCDDDPDLDCYDWGTRFQGESRDCYVAFLDRHAAEGLAACVFDNAKTIGDCLHVCTARCDTATLLDDSPMRDILFDKCHAPPPYAEETNDCSVP
jgi:hypothetical protein